MKKTVAKQVIKGVVAIIVAVISFFGGEQVERNKINTESIQQVKNSNNSKDTNNVITNVNVDSAESVGDVINTILTENKELREKIDEQEKQIDELKVSATSSKTITSKVESISTDDTENAGEDFLNLVYDGEHYELYTLSNDNGTFKIAGKEYHSGIVIDTYTGFALANLEGKYSHVSLDIGRVDESQIEDGAMIIIRDGKETNNYNLDAEKTLTSIDFDVTGTNNLKIQVDSKWSEYGIVNVRLE